MKITKEQLMEMNSGEVFATGTGTYPEIISHEIRWVAVRGEGFHDWCIYYGYENMPKQNIVERGDKIFYEEVIKRLVPCTDEAWGLYRF